MTEKKREETVEEKGEGSMKEGLRGRIRRKIRQMCSAYAWYVVVAVTAFLVGRNYTIIRSFGRYMVSSYNMPSRGHSDDRSNPCGCMTGCEMYPEEAVCKATTKPGGESIPSDLCFAPVGEELRSDLSGLPKECSEFGPLGLVSLDDLRGKSSRFKPVTEVPLSIQPYFEVNKGFSLKSALVTFLIIMKAHGESGEELMQDPFLAPMIRDLSLTPDDGLSEEERKMVGETLGLYNGFAVVAEKIFAEQKARIKKECSSYLDRGLLPVRCIAVNPELSSPNNPFAPWPTDPYSSDPDRSGTSL